MTTDSVGLQNDINMSRANVCVSGVVGGEKRVSQHDRASVLAEMKCTSIVLRCMRRAQEWLCVCEYDDVGVDCE